MKQANLHPEATACTVSLNDVEIAFVLKRSANRRFVGLRVDQNGLTVSAPIRSTENFIQRALIDNASWILKKLRAWAKYRQPPLSWSDGETVSYLGRPLRLNLIVHERAKTGVDLDLTGLVIASRHQLEPNQIQELVVEWFRGEARLYLPARLRELAQTIGLPVSRFFLSNADGRWGSCSANGDIRLNWRLMKASPAVIDYVAAHELAHLKYMDHSRAFWRTVAQIYPDYEGARRELEQNDVFYRSF